MISSYEALKDLIDGKLNGNANGSIFDTHLYNRKRTQYSQEFDNEGDFGVTEKKVVPSNIVDIVGNYINIPNTSMTRNTISLEFDIFRDSYTTVPLQEQSKWLSVDYLNTIGAIDNMIQELLATYHPLGDVNLYFGGTDSNATFGYASTRIWNTLMLDVDIKNNDVESLLYAVNGSDYYKLTKDDTNIILEVKIGVTTISLTRPYTIGNNVIYTYYDAGGSWNLVVNGNSDSTLFVTTQTSYTGGTISIDNDFNGVLHQLLIDTDIITPTDIENGLESVLEPFINLKDFTSRYALNNEGSTALTTNTVSNCILWGEEGNAIFGFETLVPISEVRFIDDGRPRQLFGLGIECLISKDIILGNLTEYFLDGKQIFPIDRQHTYAIEGNSEQYINDNFSKMYGDKNGKDLTQSFFYKPDKLHNKLVKHITSDEVVQNQSYELVVQYPFHKETYNVLIDGGGMPTNINTSTTFTVTYKQIDDNVE